MADEADKGDKPQGADALQAMQNQLNDLAKDWEAFKADVDARVAAMETAIVPIKDWEVFKADIERRVSANDTAIAPIGATIEAIVASLKSYDLELAGREDDRADVDNMLRALILQSLGLSSIATQIMANAVQSDIGENQRGLNGRTKLLHDMLLDLTPPDPAADVAGKAVA